MNPNDVTATISTQSEGHMQKAIETSRKRVTGNTRREG
jgi:hypothetical protein